MVYMQSVLIIRQKFVDAGWSLNLVDDSLVIDLKRCQLCQEIDTCAIHTPWNEYNVYYLITLNEKLKHV